MYFRSVSFGVGFFFCFLKKASSPKYKRDKKNYVIQNVAKVPLDMQRYCLLQLDDKHNYNEDVLDKY